MRRLFALFESMVGSKPEARERAPAAAPASREHDVSAPYTEEDGKVVLQYREVILATAGKGRVPTVADLPCPVQRIHLALVRAARADAAPPHIRKIAKSAIGSLVLFGGGSCSRSDSPQDQARHR